MSGTKAAAAVRHLARLARYAGRTLTTPDVIRVNGNRFRIPAAASPFMRALIYREEFGRSEVTAMRHVLRPGDVVVDIGAGIGFVGVHMARIVGAENVHMVEANADLVPYIAQNFALNGLPAPDVHFGLACADGGARDHIFNVARDFRSSSAEAIDNTLRRDTVPAVDVNTLIRDHGATVVLLDIEGSEYTLVPRCDLTTLRAVVVELHRASEHDPQVLGLLKFFVDHGFLIDTIVDFNLFIFRRAA